MTLISIIILILLSITIILTIIINIFFLKFIFKKRIKKSIGNYKNLLQNNRVLEKQIKELKITINNLQKNLMDIKTTKPIKSKDYLNLQNKITHLNKKVEMLQIKKNELDIFLKASDQEKRLLEKEKNILEKKYLEIKSILVNEQERFLYEKDNLNNPYKLKITELEEKIEELKNKFENDCLNYVHLTKEELKEEIINYFKEKYTYELDLLYTEIRESMEDKCNKEAKEIIYKSIIKLTNSQYDTFIKDITTRRMRIRNLKQWKGKIIGREGQHQKVFEKELSVDFDFPIEDSHNKDFLTLCSYSPKNREIAKIALENLISRNTFNITSIANEIEKAKEILPKQFIQDGEKVLNYLRIKKNVSNDLKQKIGELSLVYSYGQNMLNHSIEVAELSQSIAMELGVNVEIATLCGLLHDIGKVGPRKNKDHVIEGIKIINKYAPNLSPEIKKVIEDHHNKLKILESIYTAIVVAADSISAGRPGIRKQSEQIVFNRLQDLEEICKKIDGVERVNILSSGFQLLVFTNSQKIKERDLFDIEQKLIKSIQEYGKVPGTIKVALYRETKREFIINKS